MIDYRAATLAELELVLDWAAHEGWNPGLDDAAAFYAADPDGFFVAVDQAGAPRAAISVVNHIDRFAFLGLYIVDPRHRGRGIGMRLWQHALQHAGGRTIGLDGVEDQQGNYVRSGFTHAGGTTRFEGKVTGTPQKDVRPIRTEDISALIKMEGAASGFVKPNYLEAWLSPAATRTTIAVHGQKELAGFATVRRCRSGAKIGPLVAENAADAQSLITHAASLFEGPITLDVPETSAGLFTLCQQLGLQAGFKTARMYRGPFDSTLHDFFAVTSLELG